MMLLKNLPHEWNWAVISDEHVPHEPSICQALTEYEQQGWEVVSVVPDGASGRYFRVFMRRPENGQVV